jgi:hypothetical protein
MRGIRSNSRLLELAATDDFLLARNGSFMGE